VTNQLTGDDVSHTESRSPNCNGRGNNNFDQYPAAIRIVVGSQSDNGLSVGAESAISR